jgi:hypothetical protein
MSGIKTLLNTLIERQTQQHNEIIGILNQILAKENIMGADLTSLTAEVTNNTSVEQSAITLIGNLAAAITAAGTDPVALGALVTQLQTNDAALAAAVAANTVAAPTASAAAKALTK